MSRRRIMLMNRQEDDEEMKEWQLIKEEIIDTEKQTISIDFDGENYEELDILLLSRAAEEANDNLANTNAIIRVDSTTGKNFIGVIQKIMFKSALSRIAHIQIKCIPYLQYEHKVLNANNINSSLVSSYINGPGMGFDRNFDGQIKSLSVYGLAQGAMFGTGSTVIIYGR